MSSFEELKIKMRSPEPDYLVYSMWTMERMLEDVDRLYLHKQRVKDALSKHFVHGYLQGLVDAVHSKNCRLCAVLKELGLLED